MFARERTRWMPALFAFLLISAATAHANDAPTIAEQISGMQAMCSESKDAQAERQAEEPLYFRLGGYDRILEFTTEVVRLHKQNEAISEMFVYVDSEASAKHVADFISAGTGGPHAYTGRTMPAVHTELKLTDADFLSASGDIVTAMNTMGYGENEIQEFVCILVSLKDQVVFD